MNSDEITTNINWKLLFIGSSSLLIILLFIITFYQISRTEDHNALVDNMSTEIKQDIPQNQATNIPVDEAQGASKIYNKNLGISFLLPNGFQMQENNSYTGLNYLTLVYSDKDGNINSSNQDFGSMVVCPYQECMVIRHGESIFPNYQIQSNNDVKQILEKYNINNDEARIISEWQKNNISYLQVYSGRKYRFHDIVFLEFKNPNAFLAILIPSNRVYNKYQNPEDINYKKSMDIVSSIELIGESNYQKPTQPIVYENKKLGIKFTYPKDWGVIQESIESTCYSEASRAEITKLDPCEHVDLLLVDLGWPANLLSSYSILRTKNPHGGRGGYWGDLASQIESEDYIRNYCIDNNLTENCRIYRNKNGVLVAKSFESNGWGDEAWFYRIKSTHPAFYGVILSTERFQGLGITDIETKLDKIVDSISFLQ